MQCSSTSNTSGNLSTPSVDQRIVYAELLAVYKYYIGFGAFAVITNTICLIVVLSKRRMREKYGTFGVLSFGYLMNCLGILLAGYMRTYFISGNVYNSLNSFECFGRPWPYMFIFGGHLPAFILLVMGAERLLAVQKPIIYRVYVTARTRTRANVFCVLLAIISLLVGILCSYFNRYTCTRPACAVEYATGFSYNTYNNIIITVLPTIALLLNCAAYVRARQITASNAMRQELKKVLATLVIAAVAVVLTSVPNVILWGNFVYWNISGILVSQLYIAFCCNSAVDLFAFTILKQDFRNRLLSLISYGYLNRYFNLPEKVETGANQKIVRNNSAKVVNGLPRAGYHKNTLITGS